MVDTGPLKEGQDSAFVQTPLGQVPDWKEPDSRFSDMKVRHNSQKCDSLIYFRVHSVVIEGLAHLLAGARALTVCVLS